MASGGLLALLDDIMILADDVAVMTKAATVKTTGLVGDDIAVTAKMVIGTRPERETEVVDIIKRGSYKNKAFLVPAFFGLGLINGGALIPFCLLAGATFLCYEGAEKTIHAIAHKEEKEAHKKELLDAAHNDPEKSEQQKIKSAITTDFVLSAEIMAISLGSIKAVTAGAAAFGTLALYGAQFTALAAVGIITTAAVYGLVKGFVRIDDVGLDLVKKDNKFLNKLGHFMVEKLAPGLSRTLSVVGTAAMFAVGGELFMHNLAPNFEVLNHLVHQAEALFHAVPLGQSVILPLIAGAVSSVAVFPAIEYVGKPIYKNALKPWVVQPIKKLWDMSTSLLKKSGQDNAVSKAPAPSKDNEQARDLDIALGSEAEARLDTESAAIEREGISQEHKQAAESTKTPAAKQSDEPETQTSIESKIEPK